MEGHPPVDLRIDSNWPQIDEFPEVKGSPFLRNVILRLNDPVSRLFTIGYSRAVIPTRQGPGHERVEVGVCVSSLNPNVYGTWEVTLTKMAVPLVQHLVAEPVAKDNFRLVLSVIPYIIDAEGSDFRWMLIVECSAQTPDYIERAGSFLAGLKL